MELITTVPKTMEQIQHETHSKKKQSHRRRLKQLCTQIRQQIEFYFSDANLHKDRFLKKLIEQSCEGYVDLGVLITFNKLKLLTTDLILVAKALSSSSMLVLNKDRTEVKRISPVGNQKNVDDRTVYVECLPQFANHEWVKKIFSSCGNVVYVSLPKYRTTGDLKGFGFVEFETKDEAQKATEMLNNPPATVQDKPPGMFPKSKKQLDYLKSKVAAMTPSEESENIEETVKNRKGRRQRKGGNDTEFKEDCNKLSRRARKRQHSVSECSIEQDSDSSFKRKMSDTSISDGELSETRNDNYRKNDQQTKRQRMSENIATCAPERTSYELSKQDVFIVQDCSGKLSVDEHGEVGFDEKANQVMKRTMVLGCDQESKGIKRVKISDEVQVQITEPHKRRRKKKKINRKDPELPELRVIPKLKWMQLKEEYLQLQRASMNKLKSALVNQRKSEGLAELKSSRNSLQFVPDTIVKVVSDKEIHRQELKELLSPMAEVAYIDISEGDKCGHIRCKNAHSAKNVFQAHMEDFIFTPLSGVEETQYWCKVENDREKKFESKSKSKRRGRDKVLKQAALASAAVQKKHVVFDE